MACELHKKGIITSKSPNKKLNRFIDLFLVIVSISAMSKCKTTRRINTVNKVNGYTNLQRASLASQRFHYNIQIQYIVVTFQAH